MFSVYLDMCVLDFNYGMDRFGYHGDEYLLVSLGYFLASVGYFSIILRLPWRCISLSNYGYWNSSWLFLEYFCLIQWLLWR